MSRTSQAILAAAREVAVVEGVTELTLRAVADQAHVDLTTIKYHFESKAGLLEALLDSLYRDDVARFASAAADADSPASRIDVYVRWAKHDMIEDPQRVRIYYELEAYALRDPLLARRLAAHNRWLDEAVASIILGPEAADRQMATPEGQAARSFLSGAIDGMILHHALDPESYPLDGVLAAIRERALTMLGLTPGD